MLLHLSTNPRFERAGLAAQALAPLDAALLAWLAIEGPTPRARAAQLLWPDRDVQGARNLLRQRLFQLHKRLGCTLVEGVATLALVDTVIHDLDEADTVLGSIRGEDVAAGEFAQWLALQRERRQARVRAALCERADTAETARDWDGALGHAREILALDPLSEEAHRRVMRLHYLAGDRAAALLAFDGCERVLKDEIGTAPSAETLALLRTVSEADRPAAALVPRVPASVLRPPRLIGREAPWALLATAWEAGHCAIVTGEAGLGKTRLATDFAQAQGRTLVTGARPGDADAYTTRATNWLACCPNWAKPRRSRVTPSARASSMPWRPCCAARGWAWTASSSMTCTSPTTRAWTCCNTCRRRRRAAG